MSMKTFSIGKCWLKTDLQKLQSFAEWNYTRYYKRHRVRHLHNADKRIPQVKITGDRFSLHLWFRDNFGKEHRFILDGNVSINCLEITSIDNEPNFPELCPSEMSEYLSVLKLLTEICDGYILFSSNSKPRRIANGNVEKYKVLLHELFDQIPFDKQKELEPVYEWLKECDA